MQTFFTRLGTVLGGLVAAFSLALAYQRDEGWWMFTVLAAVIWVLFAGIGWAASGLDRR